MYEHASRRSAKGVTLLSMRTKSCFYKSYNFFIKERQKIHDAGMIGPGLSKKEVGQWVKRQSKGGKDRGEERG